MQRRLSRKVLLATIFAGLNLLCLLCIHHGYGTEQHTRANLAHVPMHGSGRPAGRAGRQLNGTACVVSDHHDHDSLGSLTRKIAGGGGDREAVQLAVAVLPALGLRLGVAEAGAVLHDADELAVGGAPRGPTRPRAPPIAA